MRYLDSMKSLYTVANMTDLQKCKLKQKHKTPENQKTDSTY